MNQEKDELGLIVRGLLAGKTLQYKIIRGRIEQCFSYFGIRNRTEREELVSETLAILLENLKGGRFRGDNLKALNVYILGIVRFRLYNEWRRRIRSLGSKEVIEEIAANNPRIDNQIANEQILSRILDNLPAECRNLLKLKFQEQWSDQEIADHLGKSKNAVSTAISRCLQRAREIAIAQEML